MFILIHFLALVACGVDLTHLVRATPAGSSNEKPSGLLSDARKQYNRPDVDAAQSAHMRTLQSASSGKGKGIDASYQLDHYHKTKKAAIRMSSGVMEKASYPSSASSSAHQTSVIDKQNSKMTISTNQSDENKRTKDAVDDELLMPIRQRPSGTRGETWDRRLIFNRIWREQNLSTNLPPEELAEKVLLMRTHGAHPTSSTHLASKVVKDKGDKEYEERYIARMSRMISRLSSEMHIINQDAHMSRLSHEERTKMAVDESIKMVRIQTKKKQKTLSALNTKPIATRTEAKINIEKAGKVLLDHLESKQIDFNKASLKELEQESRQLGVEGMGRRQFTRALYRYMQYHRGFKEEEMAAVKRVRRNIGKSTSRRAKRARAGIDTPEQ